MPTSIARSDDEWVQLALHLAKRGNGRVAPNPSVGCIIVKEGIVVGRGWTQPGGRPHAEAVALEQAGNNAAGATAYVTLEPCAHYGQTPPCAEALIKAGITRVVVGLSDPDTRVNGKGIALLENASIEVTPSVMKQQALRHHKGFILNLCNQRPEITLKLATSNDFKIAKANGDSKWITGPLARQYGHMLRAKNDAILVGINTVLADDPMLNCRIAGLEAQSPLRVVLDSQLKTPLTSQLVRTARDIPTLIITQQHDAKAFIDAGVKLITVPSTRDIKDVCRVLAEEGINSVLVEGGAAVAASFAQAGFVDSCAHFRAPTDIGPDGIPAIAGLDMKAFLNENDYNVEKVRFLEPDVLELYRKTE